MYSNWTDSENISQQRNLNKYQTVVPHGVCEASVTVGLSKQVCSLQAEGRHTRDSLEYFTELHISDLGCYLQKFVLQIYFMCVNIKYEKAIHSNIFVSTKD